MTLIAGLFTAAAVTAADSADAAASQGLIGQNVVPVTVTDPDPNSVELGVQFISNVAGTVKAIQFYKGPKNRGTHVGSLWTNKGTRVASVTFTNETASGWQTAVFSSPVTIAKNSTYTASYTAPRGLYSADVNSFTRAQYVSNLTLPAGGGVYAYGKEIWPRQKYQNSNYFVDVVFTPSGSAPSAGPPTTTPPTTTPPTTTPPPTTPPSTTPLLSLPRVPWEGGSDYWKKFPQANAGGWSNPSFFPIVIWYNGISTDPEVAYDKSVGINTYIGMDDNTDFSLFEDNNVFWIGDQLKDASPTSKNWVGNMLDDEVDGRFTPEEGRAYLQRLKDANAGSGRFNYANFTSIVIQSYAKPSDAQAYVNNYTDAVSLDAYWYTVPFCDWTPYPGVNYYLEPLNKANCRTASSYGKTVKMLRQQDAADGKLQPVWQFVEDLNGAPPETPRYIEPGQLKGAVMDSIINEARGIVYFNQSLGGSCQAGSVVRQSQVVPNFCGAAQIAAAKDVNNFVHSLAPVINTQSYAYTFGSGLDTMLKASGDSAYVFAMIDGASQPGSRTLTLPVGVTGSTVSVVGENRTIAVGAGRTFTDTFAQEYTYHVYKVTI